MTTEAEGPPLRPLPEQPPHEAPQQPLLPAGLVVALTPIVGVAVVMAVLLVLELFK